MASPSLIIPLPSLARLREIFDYDPETGVMSRKGGDGKPVGSPNTHGYLLVHVDGRLYRLHRLAWKMVVGSDPDGEIDHINRNRKDNRFANLRVVSGAENQLNKGPYNGRALKGASWDREAGRWKAIIRQNGKLKHLGRFDTAEEAAAAYQAARHHL